MQALNLYSGGCDGLSLAAAWVGIETLALCECDKDCREQLRRRHPGKHILQAELEVIAKCCGSLEGRNSLCP